MPVINNITKLLELLESFPVKCPPKEQGKWAFVDYNNQDHRDFIANVLQTLRHAAPEIRNLLVFDAGALAQAKTPEDAMLQTNYNELIMAVARKFPDESRHETALRYIREAESLVVYQPKESPNSVLIQHQETGRTMVWPFPNKPPPEGYALVVTHHTKEATPSTPAQTLANASLPSKDSGATTPDLESSIRNREATPKKADTVSTSDPKSDRNSRFASLRARDAAARAEKAAKAKTSSPTPVPSPARSDVFALPAKPPATPAGDEAS